MSSLSKRENLRKMYMRMYKEAPEITCDEGHQKIVLLQKFIFSYRPVIMAEYSQERSPSIECLSTNTFLMLRNFLVTSINLEWE
ncbi:hypothetical protein Tcan_09058 [Toxocara canis]|uniref:Uncharacterized protein n=1 Tax=Toxocara canis TaxID=6265 RepID=A0A0B2VB16_TOXCA|nr:hypothetical protein Tcan_09058 [Toxocara canis]